MKKHIFVTIFCLITMSVFSQNFSAIEDMSNTEMKYRIVEDFDNGQEFWEFYENNIKYVFMKTNIFSNPAYIYFEYDMNSKKRIKTIEGEQAVWIQGERSITCSGIDRIFTIEPTGGDK